jgi:DNA-directed RNA polymerase subunit M/transcription elongation factor TFIIS
MRNQETTHTQTHTHTTHTHTHNRIMTQNVFQIPKCAHKISTNARKQQRSADMQNNALNAVTA